jgi:hypothetical protein
MLSISTDTFPSHHPRPSPPHLALPLALHQILQAVLAVAVAGEVLVDLGVPLLGVYAVDNAAQLPAVVIDDPVQAPAALLRGALPGIALCSGGSSREEAGGW